MFRVTREFLRERDQFLRGAVRDGAEIASSGRSTRFVHDLLMIADRARRRNLSGQI